MKAIQGLSLVLLFLLILSIDSYSQNVICDQCPGLQWNPAPPAYLTTNLSIPGGVVTVKYRTRVCKGVYELSIVGIDLGGGLSAFSLEEIHANTMAELIKLNPMGFPPNAQDQTNYWRIIQGACWRYTSSNKTSIIACNNECCVTTIYVYYSCTGRGYELVKEVGMPNCIPLTATPELGCFYICNPLRNPIVP